MVSVLTAPSKWLEVYDRHQSVWSDISLHLRWLREHAAGTVLEIGVREGISTAALLTGVHEHGERLFSVDKEDYSSLYDSPRWTFIQGNSRLDSERILYDAGCRDNNFRFELLLLDGDHTYAGVMSDLTTYGHHANCIAIHDTNSEYLGVWEAVIAYYRAPQTEPFTKAEFFNKSSGMAVLYR